MGLFDEPDLQPEKRPHLAVYLIAGFVVTAGLSMIVLSQTDGAWFLHGLGGGVGGVSIAAGFWAGRQAD
jgi:hypothetical protein